MVEILSLKELRFGGCRHLSRRRLLFCFKCSFELYYRIYKQVLSCIAYPSDEPKEVLEYVVRRPVIDTGIPQVPAEVRE
jgi:hypothetical protein